MGDPEYSQFRGGGCWQPNDLFMTQPGTCNDAIYLNSALGLAAWLAGCSNYNSTRSGVF